MLPQPEPGGAGGVGGGKGKEMSEIVKIADEIGVPIIPSGRLVIWDIRGFTPMPECTLEWEEAVALAEFMQGREKVEEECDEG